jgi:hypothetical protein
VEVTAPPAINHSSDLRDDSLDQRLPQTTMTDGQLV